MYQPLTKVRGGFIVTPCNCSVNISEGLTFEILVTTDTEFDLDVDIDEDFYVCEQIRVTFRATRDGWKKAYRRLRQQFKDRIQYIDKSEANDLATRLRHKKLKHQFRLDREGATPCAL